VIGLLWFVLGIFIWPFRSNARLKAENAVLRQQLLVLRRRCRGRVRLTNGDRLFFVQLYRWFPSVLASFTSFGRRRSCAGTERVFAATGDGSPGIGEGVLGSTGTCER
jgi:hypothetical protein